MSYPDRESKQLCGIRAEARRSLECSEPSEVVGEVLGRVGVSASTTSIHDARDSIDANSLTTAWRCSRGNLLRLSISLANSLVLISRLLVGLSPALKRLFRLVTAGLYQALKSLRFCRQRLIKFAGTGG